MDTLVKLRERRSVAVDTTEGGKPDKAAVKAVEHSAQDRQRERSSGWSTWRSSSGDLSG